MRALNTYTNVTGLDLEPVSEKFLFTAGQIRDTTATTRTIALWRDPEMCADDDDNENLTSCSQTLLQLLAVLILFFPALDDARGPHSGNVEIHYINVGQGCGTLIVGPNGTTILYDFGMVAGGKYITPYLRRELRFVTEDHIHYAIVSYGYKDIINEGYDILIANYEPGTPKAKSPTMISNWFTPAKTAKVGPYTPIPVGLRINLGHDAQAFVAAANGVVLGETKNPVGKNENDRSVALFIR